MQLTRKTLALFAAVAASASVSYADAIDATWLGGAGSWNDPTKWSGGVVPNNAGTTTFHAIIPDGIVSAPFGSPISLDALSVLGAGTANINVPLNVSGSTTVDGWLSMQNAMTVGGPDQLLGTGRVVMMQSQLRSPAGLHVPSTLIVDARNFGQVGDATQPLVNNGRIIGNNARIYGSSIHNHGSIEGSGIFDGVFTRADLGQVTGSVFTIKGTLLNEAQTFRIDSTTSDWMLGGTIQGGTIETANGRKLYVPYTHSAPFGTYNSRLDNVVVNGEISLGNAATLTIVNGTLKGNGDVFIGTPPIEGPSRVVSATSTLTIDREMVLHGGGGVLDQLGSGSGVGKGDGIVVNHGTLRSEHPHGQGGFPLSGEFTVAGEQIWNDGTLATRSTSFLYATRGSQFSPPTVLTFMPGGTLDVEMSSTDDLGMLRVNGVLDLQTSGDNLMLATSTGVQPLTYYRIVTTTGGILGTFDSVSPGFEIEHRSGNTEIWARFVPEPSSIALPILLGGFSLVRRRRRAGRGQSRRVQMRIRTRR